MKSFIATLVLLGVMLGGILVNCIYINNVANDMLEAAEELRFLEGEESVLRAVALLEYWQGKVGLVDLSVNYLLIERVNQNLALVVTCAKAEDRFGYLSALSLLIDAIEDMRRLEELSLGGIL